MKTPDFFTKAVKDSLDRDTLYLTLCKRVEEYIDYDALADFILENLHDSIQDIAEAAAMDDLLPF